MRQEKSTARDCGVPRAQRQLVAGKPGSSIERRRSENSGASDRRRPGPAATAKAESAREGSVALSASLRADSSSAKGKRKRLDWFLAEQRHLFCKDRLKLPCPGRKKPVNEGPKGAQARLPVLPGGPR
jgi:hypothetical protein